MKAYVVGHTWGICDDIITTGVFLNKEKADRYVDIHNVPRDEAEKKYEMCKLCRKCDINDVSEDGVFILSDTCENAKLDTDRHGVYCENDKHDYYDAIGGTSYYSLNEVDLIE